MTHFMDDRAPLELTKVSTKQKIIVCPKCKIGRYVSVQCISIICVCGNYFRQEESLKPEQAEQMLSGNRTALDKSYMDFRASMEKKAYDYKENVMDKKKKGINKTHEPEDVQRLRDNGFVKD